MSHAIIRRLRAEVKDVSSVKKAVDVARKKFNEDKKSEWARMRASIEAEFDNEAKNYQIRHAMLNLFEQGESISSLCASYGTKDRATITRLIDQAKDERYNGVTIGRPDVIEITHVEGDKWLVEVQNFTLWETSAQTPYTGKIYVLDSGEFPAIDEDDLNELEVGSPLYRELVSASPQSELMKEWARCTSTNGKN